MRIEKFSEVRFKSYFCSNNEFKPLNLFDLKLWGTKSNNSCVCEKDERGSEREERERSKGSRENEVEKFCCSSTEKLSVVRKRGDEGVKRRARVSEFNIEAWTIKMWNRYVNSN